MPGDTRQKVLFLIPKLYGGGSERVLVTLLRHLDRRRFRICLAVVDMQNAAYLDDIPGDVEMVDLNYRRVRDALFAIAWMIWRRRPDTVFSTLGHLNLTLGMLRPLLPRRTRFVARETVVISELLRHMTLGRLWAMGYRLFYRHFDRIVCQSRDMRDDLVNRFGIAEDRIELIHNPADIIRIRALATAHVDTGMGRGEQSGSEIIHLVAAGRLTEQKGFDLLIDAIALRTDPRLRLTLLGEGVLRKELERRAADRGVAQQVRFMGFQVNPYPFFAQADVFVLSSRYEGMPNVVLEALACGTPVIATPAPGGVREILEGVEGCVIADGIDSASLARSLETVIPGWRLSSQVIESYRAEEVVRRYEQLL